MVINSAEHDGGRFIIMLWQFTGVSLEYATQDMKRQLCVYNDNVTDTKQQFLFGLINSKMWHKCMWNQQRLVNKIAINQVGAGTLCKNSILFGHIKVWATGTHAWMWVNKEQELLYEFELQSGCE